jgi:hypothetical protein
MTDPSPAAQAVMKAAAADQVAPLSTNRRQNDIRFGLLRIANELEGSND